MNRRRMLKGIASAVALPFAGCVKAQGAEGPGVIDPDYPPLGKLIEVNGVRLHYVDEGAGPAIVLIHGAGGNLRDWTFSMTARLRDRFRVIAFDRPGHGYSGRLAKNGADPRAQARLIADAAAALGVNRAIIAGHSWGGALVLAWALHRPEQVAGIAVLAGATYPWGGDAGLLYTLGASQVSPVVSAVARLYVGLRSPDAVIQDIFAPNPITPGYADYLGVELTARPDTFLWNSQDLDGLNQNLVEMSPRYREIAAPVEIMHGDADEIVWLDAHSRPLSEIVLNSRLTVLDGVGHMPHHVREDETVLAFERLRAAGFP